MYACVSRDEEPNPRVSREQLINPKPWTLGGTPASNWTSREGLVFWAKNVGFQNWESKDPRTALNLLESPTEKVSQAYHNW